ncbi:MAG: T9SS type A sorting domain-containing protein [Bacteroidales bacterium]|jgi:hypothetical protein
MFRNFILSIVLLFSFTLSKAQSIELYDSTGLLVNGAIIDFIGDTSYTSHIFVKNITSSSILVKVKKVELSLISGSYNTFCWTACYDSSIHVTKFGKTIPAYFTDSSSFEGYYYPHKNYGTSIIMYTFFVASDSSDSVAVIVHYNSCLNHISELKNNIYVFKINPNPANSFVEINHSLPNEFENTSFILRDILGKEIKSFRIPDKKGTITLQTSSLNDGIYFCTIVEGNNAILTQKLIVKH